MGGAGTSSSLDESVVRGLIDMLDENNSLAQAFRMARGKYSEDNVTPLRIRLINDRVSNASTYNLPNASEVAALIVGDLNNTKYERDVIIEHKSEGLRRISDLHPKFMGLQYPLLFPRGEDGYRLGIKYILDDTSPPSSRTCVTMREFYAYRLMQRMNEGLIVHMSGRLFQQYIVDAFTCIEEERLKWVSSNQALLRSELYNGLKDAMLRGDTTASSIGKRIVLPSSFTGGPRYMAQNFQDAMAICRWAGNPDLFITFTANPKWPEIDNYLQLIPGQKVEDRPDIVARVFKIRLDELMKDLIKRRHFGKVMAGT